MPRPKGSRNKSRYSDLTPEEKVNMLTDEINTLQEQLKEKRTELKKAKAEKESQLVQKAVEAAIESGKSVEDIISLLGGEQNSEKEQIDIVESSELPDAE